MLSLLSYFYSLVVRARIFLYDKRILRSHKLEKKTISIGNLTVGGTGKTPMIIKLSQVLTEKGLKVCVLTRGYKRRSSQKTVVVSRYGSVFEDAEKAGDEPVEIAMRTKACVIVDANRKRAASTALKKFKPDIFLLDDAFQHLKVSRDLDIVLIDALNPFGNFRLLPAGVLREPIYSLRRAEIFLITKVNLVDPEKLNQIENLVLSYQPAAKMFRAEIQINKIYSLKTNVEIRLEEILKKRAMAICGIANPDSFFLMLENSGFRLIEKIAFPDHHRYKTRDIHKVHHLAKERDVETLLTTVKDAVKLKKFAIPIDCFVVEADLKIPEEFTEMIISNVL